MEHPLGDAIPAAAIPDGLRVEPWSEQTDEEFRMIRNESFSHLGGLMPMPVDSWKNRIPNHTFRPELVERQVPHSHLTRLLPVRVIAPCGSRASGLP